MSEQSAAPQPVNWEAVRMLALVVGVRESARRMGLSEEAVKKRCTREGWLESVEAKRVNKLANAQRSGLTVSACPQMSPTAALNAELAALGGESRLSIARTVSKAGKHFETLDGSSIIADAGNLKSIAQTADLVHGWKDSAPQVKIRLDILGGGAEPMHDVTQDVVSEVISDWSEVDPLDEY